MLLSMMNYGLISICLDVEEFMITEQDWMYGQRDETGADRFLVLHDKANKAYQVCSLVLF
jgi:hypothetical protein